jgi:hypothetical protein
MTQAITNTINFGTECRLDLSNFLDIKALMQRDLGISFVRYLKLLSSAKKSYFFVTQLQNSDAIDEQALISTYYDVEPGRTEEDFLRDYEALMAPLRPHLHEFVDIDLPIVDEGGDW